MTSPDIDQILIKTKEKDTHAITVKWIENFNLLEVLKHFISSHQFIIHSTSKWLFIKVLPKSQLYVHIGFNFFSFWYKTLSKLLIVVFT